MGAHQSLYNDSIGIAANNAVVGMPRLPRLAEATVLKHSSEGEDDVIAL
jgi:hypothetical protein